MKEKTRIGIIGVGQIGTYHLQNYAAIPEAQVVAAADLFPDKLEAARKKFGVADVYADYREMLKRDDLDAIDVCVHNGSSIFCFQKVWIYGHFLILCQICSH